MEEVKHPHTTTSMAAKLPIVVYYAPLLVERPRYDITKRERDRDVPVKLGEIQARMRNGSSAALGDAFPVAISTILSAVLLRPPFLLPVAGQDQGHPVPFAALSLR